MNSVQEAYLKSLNPTASVKVANLNKDTIPKEIFNMIYSVLAYNYKTIADEDNGVIYIGKKAQ